MADTNIGPVTPQELLEISAGVPPELAARIRRAADQLAAFDCPPSGAGRIFAERLRQVREEGFHYVIDDCHRSEQLAWAAACYALPYADERRFDRLAASSPPREWPWSAGAWTPGRAVNVDGAIAMPIADRIRELEKAGALCAAEIDRLVRLQAKGATTI